MFKQFIWNLNCRSTPSTFVVEQVDTLCLWCLSSWELAGLEQRYCTFAVWASVCTKSLHKTAMRTACHCSLLQSWPVLFFKPWKHRGQCFDVLCVLVNYSVPKGPVPQWSHSSWFFKLWMELSWTGWTQWQTRYLISRIFTYFHAISPYFTLAWQFLLILSKCQATWHGTARGRRRCSCRCSPMQWGSDKRTREGEVGEVL